MAGHDPATVVANETGQFWRAGCTRPLFETQVASRFRVRPGPRAIMERVILRSGNNLRVVSLDLIPDSVLAEVDRDELLPLNQGVPSHPGG